MVVQGEQVTCRSWTYCTSFDINSPIYVLFQKKGSFKTSRKRFSFFLLFPLENELASIRVDRRILVSFLFLHNAHLSIGQFFKLLFSCADFFPPSLKAKLCFCSVTRYFVQRRYFARILDVLVQ